MITKEELKQATELFLKNPYWKRYYDEAPSKASKQRAVLMFFWSVTDDDSKRDEAMQKGKALESQYGLEDFKHEFKYCGNNPKKAYWKKKIDELSA